jgi:diketogulonate reductase-like aldo/keto reductase
MAEITLSNGVKMPQILLGTYRARGPAVEASVTSALSCGYRGIDTAAVYRNHKDIAATLSKVMPGLNLTRKDIFLTSKLAPVDHGTEKCRSGALRCLEELETDYLDLFLLHWPGVQKLPVDDPQNKILRTESWKVLEEMYESGTLRSIGVSNYTVQHLEHLMEHCSVVPHVNQVELHPHYPQHDLVEFCTKHSIHLQAYSSLGQNGVDGKLLSSKPVLEVASNINKSPAQVLLKWGILNGFSVLPKSTNPEHIKQNLNLDFSISDLDMKTLDNLHSTECKKYAWDPVNVL